MDYEQIVKIIDKFNSSKLTELNIEEGNFKIELKSKIYTECGNKASENSNVANEAADVNSNESSDNIIKGTFVSTTDKTNEGVHQSLENNSTADCVEIVCPLVGTFYSSKGEGEDPFIKVGDEIKEGQVIGIIEAMKLMNEITATCSGIVEAILVENEDLVEYGQAIVKVRTN